jgi:protein-tyrosine phosphatase
VGVQEALKEIQSGGKVYTHCAAGRHRSVAMAAAILIAQGLEPEGAISLIKSKRPVADPDAFHIRRRIELFARRWPTLTELFAEQPVSTAAPEV